MLITTYEITTLPEVEGEVAITVLEIIPTPTEINLSKF